MTVSVGFITNNKKIIPEAIKASVTKILSCIIALPASVVS